MYAIETHEMTPDFIKIWQAACKHLNTQVEGGIQFWLRAHTNPPVLEHLSFRLGNQLYFIHLYDANGDVEGPGSLDGLRHIADSCKGHACLMPMVRDTGTTQWRTAESGWGLIHPITHAQIDPIALLSDEAVVMTDWELHDLVVQVVRQNIEKQGYKLMSFCSDPGVDPSIWFVGASGRPEWAVVRAARYPQKRAERPANMKDISASAARLSKTGHYASVSVANSDYTFNPKVELSSNAIPIYRGTRLFVKYAGLEPANASWATNVGKLLTMRWAK